MYSAFSCYALIGLTPEGQLQMRRRQQLEACLAAGCLWRFRSTQ